jgi:hypothetical protein
MITTHPTYRLAAPTYHAAWSPLIPPTTPLLMLIKPATERHSSLRTTCMQCSIAPNSIPIHPLLFAQFSIYIYGHSVGESPPNTNFITHSRQWCTKEVLEECFWRWSNAEAWRSWVWRPCNVIVAWAVFYLGGSILCGVLWTVSGLFVHARHE